MAKKKKNPEFKRHFYINWFVQDWLGDQNLKLCPPEVRALWFDMLMQMVLSFPFGHLSRLSKPLMRESNIPLVKKILVGTLVYQNHDQTPNQSTRQVVQHPHHQAGNQTEEQENNQWVWLSVGLPLRDQLSLAINLENQIHTLTGYPPALVSEGVSLLDDLNIFSRTPNGIIYNRRMVRDFQKRKIAFVNACHGVNPYELKPATRKGSKALLYQNTEQSTEQGPNQPPDQMPEQNFVNGSGNVPHQFLSNSNSNSNSNIPYSTKSSSDILQDGISLNSTEDIDENITRDMSKPEEFQKQKTEDVRGGSGVAAPVGGTGGNGLRLDYSGLKKFKDALMDDNDFYEPFFTSTAIAKEDMASWLDLFNLHCVVVGKLEKDYREYLQHFRNWIFTRDFRKKPPSQEQVKEVAKNRKQSSDLLSKYDV